jgi:hypothetical protein
VKLFFKDVLIFSELAERRAQVLQVISFDVTLIELRELSKHLLL